MTEGAINKVLYNVDQRAATTDAEKKTARDNIGALGADDIPEIVDDRYKLLQSPLLQTFAANAVIDRFEQDAQGVAKIHCSYLSAATGSSDGLMPAADKAKLDGIQAGAEVNVQSDWAQTDTGADDFIRNKPTIPVLPPTKELVAGTGITIVEGTNEVTISSQMDAADKSKLDGIQAGAEVNVQADWTESDTTSDAYIRNKPNIPTKTSDLTNDSGFLTSQVNADWNAVSGAAEILNKPAIPDPADITWTQDNQGTTVVTEADTLDINRDTHRVQMGAGSTTVDLGFVAPPMASAPQEDMFLSMAAGNAVPTWTTAPVAHTVGFIDVVL